MYVMMAVLITTQSVRSAFEDIAHVTLTLGIVILGKVALEK